MEQKISAQRERKQTFITKDLHAFSYLPNCPEKKHWTSCISLTVFIMYSGMNYIKYNCFKMVFQSRLHFRISSFSDVFCSYISENPEASCKFCIIPYF